MANKGPYSKQHFGELRELVEWGVKRLCAALGLLR